MDTNPKSKKLPRRYLYHTADLSSFEELTLTDVKARLNSVPTYSTIPSRSILPESDLPEEPVFYPHSLNPKAPHIVLDVGTSLIKAGYIEDITPRAIIAHQSKTHDPELAFTDINAVQQHLSAILSTIFLFNMPVEMHKAHITVVCPLLSTSIFRLALLRSLLLDLECHEVTFMSQEQAIARTYLALHKGKSLAKKSRSSATPLTSQGIIIIDAGHSETRITPVIDGQPLINIAVSNAALSFVHGALHTTGRKQHCDLRCGPFGRTLTSLKRGSRSSLVSKTGPLMTSYGSIISPRQRSHGMSGDSDVSEQHLLPTGVSLPLWREPIGSVEYPILRYIDLNINSMSSGTMASKTKVFGIQTKGHDDSSHHSVKGCSVCTSQSVGTLEGVLLGMINSMPRHQRHLFRHCRVALAGGCCDNLVYLNTISIQLGALCSNPGLRIEETADESKKSDILPIALSSLLRQGELPFPYLVHAWIAAAVCCRSNHILPGTYSMTPFNKSNRWLIDQLRGRGMLQLQMVEWAVL